MMRPIRVQRKRVKGWKMPENTISVSRPSVMGNPFIVGEPSGYGFADGGDQAPLVAALTLEQCIDFYRQIIGGTLSPEMHPRGHQWMARFKKTHGDIHPTVYVRSQLRGSNLACYCALDQPCHVDALLEIACS